MLQVSTNDPRRTCAGLSRRSLLRAGFLGLAGLTLPDLYRLRAAHAAAGRPGRHTAVIQVWLDGGPSQLETYDPTAEAPSELTRGLEPLTPCLQGRCSTG